MSRPVLTSLIALSSAAAMSLVIAPPASAYEVQTNRYTVAGSTYTDGIADATGTPGTVDAEASLYMSNNGSLSSVNVWPGRVGSDALHLDFAGTAARGLKTSNNVTLDGICAKAQIQMAPKTTDGLRGTATVLCTRTGTNADGSTATSRYMIAYGFAKPTLNCVMFSSGGASIVVPDTCPGSVHGVTILANGKQERTSVSATVTAPFTASRQP